MNYKTAIEYMENIIKPLLISISEKFSTFDCKYTSYKIENDKSFYKISLNFKDENNYLEKIIIPYLMLTSQFLLRILELEKNKSSFL